MMAAGANKWRLYSTSSSESPSTVYALSQDIAADGRRGWWHDEDAGGRTAARRRRGATRGRGIPGTRRPAVVTSSLP